MKTQNVKRVEQRLLSREGKVPAALLTEGATQAHGIADWVRDKLDPKLRQL